jgi:hypothetical protein
VVTQAALSPRDAAAYVGLSVRTLYSLLESDPALRRCRVYPTPSKPVFVVARLDKWLSTRPDTAQVRS